MSITLKNRRIKRDGYYRWQRPRGQKPTLTPATTAPRFPPFVTPMDYDIVEDWNKEGTAWRPGDLTITPADPSAITDWQVSADGNSFLAAVELPELAVYAGFPAAVFLSVSLSHPSNNNGIDPTKPWSFQFSLGEAFDNVVISPVSSYLGANGVSFAAYARGVVKQLDLPVIRLTLDCYWSTDGYTTYSGEFLSNVTIGAPFIQDTPPKLMGALDVPCPKCKEREGQGWVVINHPVTPLLP